MPSKIKKHQGRWRFRFYSSRKTPNTKEFTFNADDYKKSDVQRIRDHYTMLWKTGQWDPWTDPIESIRDDCNESVLLTEAIAAYLEHIPIELAPKTVSVAGDCLKQMEKKMADLPCHRLTGQLLTDYVNSYETYHYRRTIHYHVARLMKYCQTQGWIDELPKISLYGTKAEKKQQRRIAITYAQLQQLLTQFEIMRDQALQKKHVRKDLIRAAYQRHIDITQVCFFMGLRLNDVLHARPAWIINDGRFLRIGDLHRWGLKDRYSPKSQREHDDPIVIPPEVHEIFRRRKAECNGMYKRLFGIKSAKQIQVPLKAACCAAFGDEFCEQFSPHSLRHSCATYWLNERRVPIQEVQRLMRHADIRMTQQYYHPSTDAHYAAFHGGVMRVIS